VWPAGAAPTLDCNRNAGLRLQNALILLAGNPEGSANTGRPNGGFLENPDAAFFPCGVLPLHFERDGQAE
jgi:hypothetical protein